MKTQIRAVFKGLVIAFSALLLAAGLVGAAYAKAKPQPVAPEPPPPPVEAEIPVGPPTLAGFLIDSASVYAAYMRAEGALSPAFADGASVANELRIGAASEKHQLQQGLVAYAAIVALQDPTFVEGVRVYARHASTRDQIVRYIMDNPAYVMSLDGHDSAAQRVMAILGGQALRVKTVADRMEQESLDIQLKSAWSKRPVPDPNGRLALVKQLSSAPFVAPDDVRAQLSGAASGSAPLQAETPPPAPDASPAAAPPAYTEAVERGMAIAALAVLGKAGEPDLSALMPLLADAGDSDCFNMSKLNLYQCLAVAKPYYEDIYCLGLHGVGDIGRCVMHSVGVPEPAAPVPLTEAAPPPAADHLAAAAPPRRR